MKKLRNGVIKCFKAEKNKADEKYGMSSFVDCNHFFGVIYEEYQESKLELKKIKKQMKFVFDFTHKGETGTPFLACLLKLREMAISAACELIQLAVVCQRGIDCFLDKEKEDKK